MDIAVGTPGSIATPPAGFVTLFLDTTNNNILSYKDENGNVYIYNQGNADAVGEDCCCEIAKDLIGKIGCSLKDGMISATDFQNIVNQGVTVSGSSTDDGQGNKTCSVQLMASNIPVTGISTAPSTIGLPGPAFNVGNQAVIVATITPANASNKTVIWSSSNVAVATVNANGVVTAIGAGSCTITATTADGLFTDTTSVTVS